MELPVNYNNLLPHEKKNIRDEYIKIQNNLCFFCKKQIFKKAKETKRINKKLFPENFFRWSIHLHHDHKTGMTIGAVHSYCNAVLWQYYGE